MSTINDGGPAFPSTHPAQDFGAGGTLPAYHQDGMTLRAYFAAHAPITYQDARLHLSKLSTSEFTVSDVINWLTMARKIYADAMIAAMERKA